jgi:hypothetical protein
LFHKASGLIIPSELFGPGSKGKEQEEKMIKRFHGIDRHKISSTISILNREGIEEKLVTDLIINPYRFKDNKRFMEEDR